MRFDRAPAYGQIGLDFGAAGGREGAAVALAGDLGMCAAGCADVERRGVHDGSAGDPTAAGGRQALQYLRFGYADADVAVADVVDFGIDRQQQDALFVDRRDDMADDLFVGFDDEFFRIAFDDRRRDAAGDFQPRVAPCLARFGAHDTRSLDRAGACGGLRRYETEQDEKCRK